jgi:hypothetical protein
LQGAAAKVVDRTGYKNIILVQTCFFYHLPKKLSRPPDKGPPGPRLFVPGASPIKTIRASGFLARHRLPSTPFLQRVQRAISSAILFNAFSLFIIHETQQLQIRKSSALLRTIILFS